LNGLKNGGGCYFTSPKTSQYAEQTSSSKISMFSHSIIANFVGRTPIKVRDEKQITYHYFFVV
jgi:hypothetical protein